MKKEIKPEGKRRFKCIPATKNHDALLKEITITQKASHENSIKELSNLPVIEDRLRKQEFQKNINYRKANKKRSGFNKRIWGSIHEFIKHWKIINEHGVARRDIHTAFINDSQWASLAALFDSAQKYGAWKIENMIKEQIELAKTEKQQTGLLSVCSSDIILNEKGEKEIKDMKNYWNKRLRRDK